MTNSEILQKIARRELTPEDATTIMLADDERRDGPLHASWIEILSTIIAVVLIVAFFCGSIGHSQAPRWTQSDGLFASQACVHEADFDSLGDCGGIIQVVESRRRSGETFSAALRRTMPRFTAGRTDRVWALHLPYGPITENPEGWPYTYGAAHHSAQWRAVVERVRGYMLGGVALPCSPQPISWLGRQTDGHVLAERLDSGRWRESSCGPTSNAFLYLADVD